MKLTRTIYTDFPFIPSQTVRDTVSRLPPPPPPPPPRGLVKFRNSARPWLHLSPSRSAKSFFKLRLAAGRSETVRQRGKKRSRREPLGLFPTSSVVQTRRMPKPRPLSTGSPSTLFRRHRFSGEYGSLPFSLSFSLDRASRDREGETSRRNSHQLALPRHAGDIYRWIFCPKGGGFSVIRSGNFYFEVPMTHLL